VSPERKHKKSLKRLLKPTKNSPMLMNELADPSTIQLAFLFPFMPLVAVAIVTYALGYDLRNDNEDDDDDDDRGTLVPAYYPV
tara:strand:- start:217 stop:465 length:249 start_codon:yes stop_codon:yes gene_type:complete